MKDLSAIAKSWDYYLGDKHRENWIGVRPDLSTETGKKNEEAIARLLQSIDILGSVVDFHVGGLLGKLPILNNPQLSPVLEAWRGSTSALGDMDSITYAITKAKATGYGYLRLMRLETGEVLIHSPEPESVVIERDENERIISIEYSFIQDKVMKIERQTILPDGLTLFEYLKEGEIESSLALSLEGKFSIQEFRLKPLITPSTQRSQDAINHALTMIPRGNELSGFLARFFTNGRPPGEWKIKPDGSNEFLPDPDGLIIGAGVVNFISGLPITDQAGNITGYTSVGVHSDPPLPIASFTDTFNLFSAIIYLQSNQAHRLGYALTLSGRSREELRGDFILALNKDKASIERGLRRCLLVYAAMAGLGMMSDLGVDLQLTTGVLSQEEKNFILEMFKANLLDRDETIARLEL